MFKKTKCCFIPPGLFRGDFFIVILRPVQCVKILSSFARCGAFVRPRISSFNASALLRIIEVALCTDKIPWRRRNKNNLKCCFWTTGEDHLMSRNDSDGEFSGRVTEASQRRSKSDAQRTSRNDIVRMWRSTKNAWQ